MWKKIFVCAFIAQIFSIVGFNFALPFLPFFVSQLGNFDKGEIAFWAGIVLGASGITFSIFSPIWGILADRYGRKIMVVRAMFGGTIVLLLMSFVKTVGQLIICRLFQGAFTGTISASVALVAGVAPLERTGFLLGMMQSAVFIGEILGPFIGGIFSDIYGYRIVFRIGAGIIFLGGILVLFGTHENFDYKEKEIEKGSFWEILKMKNFIIAVIILFFIRLIISMANPSFPLIVKEIASSSFNINSITGSIIGVSAFSGAISSAILGYFGDKLGHKRILILCCYGATLSLIGHFFSYSLFSLFISRIFLGIFLAGMIPSVNALICKIVNQNSIGKAYGWATSISFIGVTIGPVLGGILSKSFNLRVPFLFSAISLIFLAFFMGKVIKEKT